MAKNLKKAIERKASLYANGEMSLQAFERYFLPISLSIEESGDQSAIELTHRIDGILAEASSGKWTQTELRQELANAVRPFADLTVRS